jgi:hypothetical protein
MSQMMSRKRIIQYQARDELRRCTNCRTRSCRVESAGEPPQLIPRVCPGQWGYRAFHGG